MTTYKSLDKHLEEIQELIDFSNNFNQNSNERDTVIIGVSYIETLMNQILENFFIDGSKTVEKLLKHTGALGSLNAKVDLAYCSGLIEKTIKTDLGYLAEIRNQFAHNFKTSFEDERVKKLCDQFKWHEEFFLGRKPPKDATSFDIFKVELNTIISNLQAMKDLAVIEKRKVRNG
ncbi:MAG: hypothetical protein ACJA08_003391 [Cyclobacteriaceae bacterium]|jgi:hypothetical protein